MSTCDLCDLPVTAQALTAEGVDGTFCCNGCLEVARALDSVDEADELDAREVPERTEHAERTVPEDATEAFLAVDGMHCTTCEAFLDLVSDRTAGVYEIDANYGMETARVVYDSTVVDDDALPELLSTHGYTFRYREDDPDAGISRAARRRQRAVAERLLVGGFFTVLIMPWYLFTLYPGYLGFESGVLDVDTTTAVGLYLPLVFIAIASSIVLFYTGYPVLRGAWISVRTGHPNVDLLVSIAALSAYAYSTLALAGGSTHLYYDVSVMVVMIVTLGRYYEGTIRTQTIDALSAITAARVREATRRTTDGRETVPIDSLQPDDHLVVAPGERVPVDGTVVEGIADVDEAVLTGESLPITKRPGDDVVGGSLVVEDALVVAVGPDAESTIDRIVTALWEIQSATPGAQRFADALATVFVPLVFLLGITVTLWQLTTGSTVAVALLSGLTVLVVSCPCAMGLATPLAISGGLRDALDRGLVVTNEAVFEVAPGVDTVVFDKTGTLTAGEMHVTGVYGHRDTLRFAAAVERFSSHPVADAILDAATKGGEDSSTTVSDGGFVVSQRDKTLENSLPTVAQFTRHPGRGVSGTVGSHRVVVGTPSLVESAVGSIPTHLTEQIEATDEQGGLPVVVGWNGQARGVVSVADREREEWQDALEAVADRRVAILTGDDEERAAHYREHDAVDDVFAGVPPDGKVETIRRLARTGTTVMVGDGTNDAPALAAADLGIAMGDGTAWATDAADVVVTTNDLTAVPEVFSLATGTRRRIRENVCWALLYNAIAIPLAVAGLINPLFAALAMSASSIIVVSNSRRPVFRT